MYHLRKDQCEQVQTQRCYEAQQEYKKYMFTEENMTRKERYMLKEEKIVVDIKLKLSRKMRRRSSSSSRRYKTKIIKEKK